MSVSMHGKNFANGSKYRILLDDEKEKIKLFKKEGNELIPLAVWSYDRLINEMKAHDD